MKDGAEGTDRRVLRHSAIVANGEYDVREEDKMMSVQKDGEW